MCVCVVCVCVRLCMPFVCVCVCVCVRQRMCDVCVHRHSAHLSRLPGANLEGWAKRLSGCRARLQLIIVCAARNAKAAPISPPRGSDTGKPVTRQKGPPAPARQQQVSMASGPPKYKRVGSWLGKRVTFYFCCCRCCCWWGVVGGGGGRGGVCLLTVAGRVFCSLAN